MPSISPDGNYLAIVVGISQSVKTGIVLIDLMNRGNIIPPHNENNNRENSLPHNISNTQSVAAKLILRPLQDGDYIERKAAPDEPFEIKSYEWGTDGLTYYMGPSTSTPPVMAADIHKMKSFSLRKDNKYTLKNESRENWEKFVYQIPQ